MTLLSTILFGALGLGVMVFVHELGHFLAARANGVHVEIFSLGWGTRLVGYYYHGTWYQISWFPLGGYCRMRGDEALHDITAGEDGEEDRGDTPAPKEGSLNAAPPWRRIIIIAAGPLANLLSAALLLSLLWGFGFWVRSEPSRVVLAADYPLGAVPHSTPAEIAGLQTGDTITAIDGRPIKTFQELREAIATSPERSVELLLWREGVTLAASITPTIDVESLTGRIWVYPWLDPVVDVEPGEPAAIAGLEAGDRIVAVEGTSVEHTVGYAAARQQGGRNSPASLTVERDGRLVDVALPTGVRPAFVLPRFRMGGESVFEAVSRGVHETGRAIGLTVRGLGLLFRGNAANAVAGPLRISYYVGTATSQGFQESFGAGLVEFTRLIALISVALFLMNLLPVPALDGGHIALYLFEMIRGRPVSPVIVDRMRRVGFSLLLLLAVTLTFSDLRFLFSGGR